MSVFWGSGKLTHTHILQHVLCTGTYLHSLQWTEWPTLRWKWGSYLATSTLQLLTSLRPCDLSQVMWPLSSHVTSLRSCDLSQAMWPLSGHVTPLRSCDLSQAMWPLSGYVTSLRPCDLSQAMWPLSGYVNSLRPCDLSQVMWPLSGQVTSLRSCDLSQAMIECFQWGRSDWVVIVTIAVLLHSTGGLEGELMFFSADQRLLLAGCSSSWFLWWHWTLPLGYRTALYQVNKRV